MKLEDAIINFNNEIGLTEFLDDDYVIARIRKTKQGISVDQLEPEEYSETDADCSRPYYGEIEVCKEGVDITCNFDFAVPKGISSFARILSIDRALDIIPSDQFFDKVIVPYCEDEPLGQTTLPFLFLNSIPIPRDDTKIFRKKLMNDFDFLMNSLKQLKGFSVDKLVVIFDNVLVDYDLSDSKHLFVYKDGKIMQDHFYNPLPSEDAYKLVKDLERMSQGNTRICNSLVLNKSFSIEDDSQKNNPNEEQIAGYISEMQLKKIGTPNYALSNNCLATKYLFGGVEIEIIKHFYMHLYEIKEELELGFSLPHQSLGKGDLDRVINFFDNGKQTVNKNSDDIFS